MIDYSLILVKNYAGKKWALIGDDYAGLEWSDETPKPTKEELDALWEPTQVAQVTKRQAEVAAKESAISKLTALGLTADEVKAILGAT
jgi:hypothetical protein